MRADSSRVRQIAGGQNSCPQGCLVTLEESYALPYGRSTYQGRVQVRVE